jgi:hypothetical protein
MVIAAYIIRREQCAITRSDVLLLKFKQRRRQPYNAVIVSNLTQRLGQNRSMTIKSTWVKAHQDEDQLPGQVLSDAALRNTIDVDSIANDYLLDTRQPQTQDNAAQVDAQAISISIQGTIRKHTSLRHYLSAKHK